MCYKSIRNILNVCGEGKGIMQKAICVKVIIKGLFTSHRERRDSERVFYKWQIGKEICKFMSPYAFKCWINRYFYFVLLNLTLWKQGLNCWWSHARFSFFFGQWQDQNLTY